MDRGSETQLQVTENFTCISLNLSMERATYVYLLHKVYVLFTYIIMWELKWGTYVLICDVKNEKGSRRQSKKLIHEKH